MMKILSLFFLFLFSSCDVINDHEEYYQLYADRDYSCIYEEIKSAVTKKIQKNRKFHCISSCGSAMAMVKLLGLSFTFDGYVGLENARKMIVDAAELFLQTVNQDKRIRPYLVNYPFEPSNISLVIFFKESASPLPGNLCYVSLHRGYVRFHLDPGGRIPSKLLLEETYEEALQIVREENSKTIHDSQI